MYLTTVLFEMYIWDHVVAAVICIFAPIMAYSSRKMVLEDLDFEAEDKIRLYHSNGLLLVVFALIVTTLWRVPGRSLSGLGFAWPEWNIWIGLLLTAVFVFYLLDIFFQYGLPKWRQKTIRERSKAMSFVPSNSKELFHFILLAFAAGIGEEIVFRGFLIHYIIYWTGNSPDGLLTACFFSSALFAFLHGYQGYKSMVKIFFLAFLFSGIFILSKSLLIVIALHTLVDIFSGWLGIVVYKNIPQEESSDNES
jgi:membrane protease YdiL (CAAX protease family)